jgi:hypothetical protein
MTLDVLTAVMMLVFWVVTPCGLVGSHQHTASIFLAEALKMKAV